MCESVHGYDLNRKHRLQAAALSMRRVVDRRGLPPAFLPTTTPKVSAETLTANVALYGSPLSRDREET